MLDKEWIIANVHLCYEYKRCLSDNDVFGLSGDLYNLLEIVKAPLSPTSATPRGAKRAGRIVLFSPRRWWDAQGGAETYPEARYIALRSTRRGEPIEVIWSLPGTAWLVFKLRWEAITGLALPEDPATPPSEPAPPLPPSEPYNCVRPLLGYTSVLSPTAGREDVPVHVSSSDPSPFTAELHQLISWDVGVGIETKPVNCAAIDGFQFPATHQPMRVGSYAQVNAVPGSFPCAGHLTSKALQFTLACHVWPTAPQKTRPQEGVTLFFPQDSTQVIISCGGIALLLTPQGHLALRIGSTTLVETLAPLLPREWATVCGSFDGEAATICVAPHVTGASGSQAVQVISADVRLANHAADVGDGSIVTLAANGSTSGGAATEHYNGKLAAPAIWAAALDLSVFVEAASSASSGELLDPCDAVEEGVASLCSAWDFASSAEATGNPGSGSQRLTDRLVDTGPCAHHGQLFNGPTQGSVGPRWASTGVSGAGFGEEHCWRHAPMLYNAVHFHEDDVSDAGWEESLRVPTTGLPTGVYGVLLKQAGRWKDWIPFFVRPASPQSDVAFLVPTASYLAYSNNVLGSVEEAENCTGGSRLGGIGATFSFLQQHPEFGLSTYDSHKDGSGVSYVSTLRPQLMMRPGEGLWQFPADSHLVSFLHAHGIRHDIVTDEHLHTEGVEALSCYRCVITGTHPEYYSSSMMVGIREFTRSGGRLLYLGANGFYWHVAFKEPQCCHNMEMRRAEDGMRFWLAEPGEYHMSYTGELGGLWRRKGAPPQSTAGVGFTAQGFDACVDYEVLPASADPRASFIFDGVPEGIGDRFGQEGMSGGAAGLEIDRADISLGTPAHALRVAVADKFPASYKRVGEEALHSHSAVTGLNDPKVKADVIFYELPGGGAVFTTGSIAWAGALPPDGYNNSVAIITKNVIERFVSPQPFAPPALIGVDSAKL